MSYFNRLPEDKWKFEDALAAIMKEFKHDEAKQGLSAMWNIIKEKDEDICREWKNKWNKYYQKATSKQNKESTMPKARSSISNTFNIEKNKSVTVKQKNITIESQASNSSKRSSEDIVQNDQTKLTASKKQKAAVNRNRADSLFTDEDTSLASAPSPTPTEFRKAVYAYGVKALGNKLLVQDNFELQKLLNSFVPTTLGEQLDVMSAKLTMSVDQKNTIQANTLKLSLSRIVDFVNGQSSSLYQQYLDNAFWEQVKGVKITLCPGMPDAATKLYEAMISEGSVDGKLMTRQLRLAIAKKKLSLLESDDPCSLQVLDILDLLAKRCLADSASKPHSAESELAAYRKIAKILDEILDGTMLDMLDGESVCKASKSIAKVHEKIYGSTVSLNSGFGRRIDLIISTKERELSTSEWKRSKTSTLKCLQQQCKNIRMNKAILANILQLPLDEPDRDAAFTVGMDWVGNKGYMLAVKRVQDVYVAKPLSVLLMPQYVYEIPSFKDTLNCLYAWRNHHLDLKEIMLPAFQKCEQDAFFTSLLGTFDCSDQVDNSPNVYLTPSQRRQKQTHTADSGNSNDLDDLEDFEEYDEDEE